MNGLINIRKGEIKMKLAQKVVGILFILIIIIAFGAITVKASDKITFSVEDINDVEPGSTINVVVQAKNLENASQKPIGIKLDLLYNPDVIEYISAEKGKNAGSAIALHENYTDEGRIRIGLVSFADMNQSGEYYSVQFKVKDNISVASTPITLEVAEVSDSSGNAINCDVQNAIISFKGVTTQENPKQEEKDDANKKEINSENQVENNEKDNEKEEAKGEDNVDKTEQSLGIAQKIAITDKDENITSFLKEDSKLEVGTELTYEVENPEILEIDEQGNIVPKEKGTTKVTIRDTNNQEEIITIEVGNEETLEENSEVSTGIILISLGVIIIVVTVTIVVKKKKEPLHS